LITIGSPGLDSPPAKPGDGQLQRKITVSASIPLVLAQKGVFRVYHSAGFSSKKEESTARGVDCGLFEIVPRFQR
jgi:hypothetical protein